MTDVNLSGSLVDWKNKMQQHQNSYKDNLLILDLKNRTN